MADVSESFEPLAPIEATPKKRSPLLLWVIGIVVAVALLAGGAIIGAGKEDDPLELLSAAPAAVRDEGSARIEMTMTMGGDDMSMDVDGEGVVDFESGAGTFEVTSMGFVIEVITDGETVWFKLPFGGLGGKTWIGAPADAMEGQEVPSSDLATNVLDSLRDVGGEIEDLGTEEINGVDATHYATTIDLAEALAAMPGADRAEAEAALNELGGSESASFPVDVWITDDGLPVRTVLSFEGSGDMGSGMVDDLAVRMQIDLSDFGVPVEITPPDPSDVRYVEDPSELDEIFVDS